MKRAIRAHLRDFLAIVGLLVLAVGIGGVILHGQRLRFPIIEAAPKNIELELENAQAVQPGQGQTVRVAGVEVGKIGDVKLEDGHALVELQIEHRYRNLIREDATALLRPKTALKDMFVEVSPGTGRVIPAGGHIPLANSAPDIDPDEIYAALDRDTRDYLKLLVAGAGKGLRGRGADLREVFRRLEPLHRDLARVTRATARRRHALKSLVHEYSLLIHHVGRRPDELRRLVDSSHAVFDSLARENRGIETSVARLPGALRASESTLHKVDRFAAVLKPSLESLRPPIRKLPATNAALTPFLRDTEPALRTQIRPFVRAARPWTDDLRVAAKGTSRAAPDLSDATRELNRFFNIGAYNPGGAESLDGKSLQQQLARQEGYLYWLAWTAQNGVSLFSTADAQGPWRRVTICGLPAALITGLIGSVLSQVGAENPALVDQLLGGPGGVIQPGSPLDTFMQSQFGSCNFNALPTGGP
jgi:phospholipid/cholesterol/gamma-HCH transport system substrate-binding protein